LTDAVGPQGPNTDLGDILRKVIVKTARLPPSNVFAAADPV
jgi:hypothetical protein